MNPDLQTILDEFTLAASLPRFDPQDSLPHTLLIDRKWVINLTEEEDHLVLYASPGTASSIPHNKNGSEPQWFFLSPITNGISMRIGLHTSSKVVILHTAANAGALQNISLRSWLDQFIEQLEIWFDMLAPATDGAPAPEAAVLEKPEKQQSLSRDWLRG